VVEQKAFQNLAISKKKGENGIAEIEEGKAVQVKIIGILQDIGSEQIYKNRDEFTKLLKDAFIKADLTIGAQVLKLILAGLSEKDETAEICMKNKKEAEADADLRDTENIPFKEDIYEYFELEVTPHVSDAWIDDTKTKIGYEIPFTRYFYQYTSLRSSEEIKQEIKVLEEIILGKLKKVMG
jgi:type I restriction enzyme M protein